MSRVGGARSGRFRVLKAVCEEVAPRSRVALRIATAVRELPEPGVVRVRVISMYVSESLLNRRTVATLVR